MKYIRTYNSAHTLGAEIQFLCVLQLLDTQQGSVMVQDLPDNELISESLKGNMAKLHDLHDTILQKNCQNG